MSWWLWALLGLAMSALELVTGGFFLIFFGVAALFVGVFTALNLTGPPEAQWLEFALASVVLLAAPPLATEICRPDDTTSPMATPPDPTDRISPFASRLPLRT